MAKPFITPSLIGISRRKTKMKIKYFQDTDTAHFEFSRKKIKETKEISENIYIDIDTNGNLVNMTIEHAKENAGLPKLSFKEIKSSIN